MASYLGRLFIVIVQSILAVLCLERVNMYRSVRGLSSDVFVEGIPGHALDIMTVLGYLSYEGVGADIVDTSYVVHASDNEVVRVWRPC